MADGKLREKGIEATEVHERVWVGSAPDRGSVVADRGFTHLVLCAHQYQPAADVFPGVTVLHCPYEDDDSIMTGSTMTAVFLAARAVAEAQKGGGNVLVTCVAGINRSALVASLALQMLGVPAWITVERIRAKRYPNCLGNTCFLRIALGQNRAVSHYLPEALTDKEIP
jgi:hypothetical protein